MKDIDEFIDTYVVTGRYGKDMEDTKDRAAAKLTDLLKKAFEAGRETQRKGQGLWTAEEPKYPTFGHWLTTQL